MFKFIPLKQIHSCHKTQLPPAEITCAKLGIKRGICSSQLCCRSVVQEVSLPNAFLFILTFVTHSLTESFFCQGLYLTLGVHSIYYNNAARH